MLVLGVAVSISSLIAAQAPQEKAPEKAAEKQAEKAPEKAAAAPAAPAAAANVATGYMPAVKGTGWTYKSGENTIEMVIGETGTLDTMVAGKKVASETIETKADGIYRTKVNGVAIEPPVKIMALPADGKDVNWDVASKLNAQEIKGKFTQKGTKEKITVMGQPVEAILVEGNEFSIANTKCTVKQWFVDGKFMVKMVYSIAGNESMIELTGFKPAK